MKIDRRSFLSLGMGLSAGVALTPLPWKMMDDVSIWSQNWPWTSVPEDGKVAYEKTVCSLCPGGCGISVRKVNDRAVKVEGTPGHPVNNGGICILGISSLQLLYGPTRVKTPLKRVGKRGEGKWEKISWQAAIDEVVAKLKELREKGEAHTAAAIMGSDRGTVPRLIERLLTVFGSPNFFRMPSVQDAYELTFHLMHGAQAMAGFDVANTDFVMSFGSGVLEGWGSPVHMFQANSRWKASGVKVVQVEPRLSNTAAKADDWVAITPGTESALALGMAHVIIKENRLSDFAADFSFGFDDWQDPSGQQKKGFKQLVLESYSPDKVAEMTGVTAEKIAALAKEFASAKRPVALAGRGAGNTPGSVQETMAIHALNALAGSINSPGGVWTVPDPDYIKWPNPEMDQVAAKGIQNGRIDGAGSSEAPNSRYLLNRLAKVIGSESGYPLKALFISGANPLHSLPDTQAFQKALDAIPFIASFSSYFDETTEYADLVLPNHMFLERLEDVPAPTGFPKPIVGLSRPVVAPQCDTRHVGDVIIEIGKKLGGTAAKAFPWIDYETCLRGALSDKWRPMRKNGFWWNSSYKPRRNSGYDTPSGKFEFSAAAFSSNQPVALEGDESSFPLILMPYDSMRISSGYAGSPPFMMKTVSDSIIKGNDGFVEINPETAKKLSLRDGQFAVLTTPKGSARVRVHHFDGIRPGVLAMPRGLGHTAYDDYLANKGVNIHSLIGPVEDPASGLDAAWGIRAKLTKA